MTKEPTLETTVSDENDHTMTTTQSDVRDITSWHAHVYFGPESRDDAWGMREVVASQFGDRVQIGRFHERPVGPHPRWSFQIEFLPDEFAGVMSWLALNHRGLDVFAHPNTDDELRDHRDSAIWIGRSHALLLSALDG